VNSFFPSGINSAPTSVDYDIQADNIQCFADFSGARIFEFEEAGRTLRVLAHDAVSAREAAEPELRAIRHEVHLDIADDYETTCWCGESGKVSDLYDDTGLDVSCGGLGSLNCRCGGDQCVCHYHGETDCPGCPDCENDCDDDWGDESC
jgi:hypothetical protein